MALDLLGRVEADRALAAAYGRRRAAALRRPHRPRPHDADKRQPANVLLPPRSDHNAFVGTRLTESFAAELRTVWRNVLAHAADGARLVIRFGGIHDRSADPLAIIKDSLRGSGWRVCTRRSAGVASRGRRQADHFQPAPQAAREEFDIWACLDEALSTTTDSRQRSSPTA